MRAAIALTAVGVATGCGQGVEPGMTQHRLYSWSCPRAEGGRAYLVLRYKGQWVDASKSSRVGLIKFKTDPEPSIHQDRWVWGVPTGQQEFVLFDAMRNRIIRRTGYVRRLDLGQEPGDAPLLAFAASDGVVEVVQASGRVVVPQSAGFTGAATAFRRLDGTAILAMRRADGELELRSADGGAADVGLMLTTLNFEAIGP